MVAPTRKSGESYTRKSTPSTPSTPSFKSAPSTQSTPAGETNLEHAIRERAYAIWESIGRPHGQDVEIWLQAKKEILGKNK